jgi:hypothetical protein
VLIHIETWQASTKGCANHCPKPSHVGVLIRSVGHGKPERYKTCTEAGHVFEPFPKYLGAQIVPFDKLPPQHKRADPWGSVYFSETQAESI